MPISISERALEQIHEIRRIEQHTSEARLRVGVVGGGCSGLTYKLEFDSSETDPNSKERVIEIDDLIVVVDMRSFLYLAGTQLDYTDGLNGKGFHFVNPNASRTCSCGESFAV